MGVMKLLLDTHTLLWAIRGSEKLGRTAKMLMNSDDYTVHYSAVSAYEIMYKHNLGKLMGYSDIAENYFEALITLGAEELPITTQHAHFAGKFDWSHRDPFDRLLAAQAFVEGMILLTDDAAFKTLPWVNTAW